MKTMKKLSVVLVAAMMLVLAACGIDKSKALETYAQTKGWKDMIASAEAQAKAQGMTLKTAVEGNTITYEYIFEDGTLGDDVDTSKLKELLDKEIEKQRASVNELAAGINEEVGIDDTKIKFIYSYGSEKITEAEFEAE